MKYIINFNDSPLVSLINLINNSSTVKFTVDQLTIDYIVPSSEATNTTARISPTGNNIFKGSVDLNYNRLDMNDLNTQPLEIEYNNNYVYEADLLPEINNHFKLNLLTNEIRNNVLLEVPAGGELDITLSIKPDHPVFNKGCDIKLTSQVEQRPLTVEITTYEPNCTIGVESRVLPPNTLMNELVYGDGSPPIINLRNTNTDKHIYEESGTYTLTFLNPSDVVFFSTTGNMDLKVKEWGTSKIGQIILGSDVIEVPCQIPRWLTNLAGMFSGASRFNQDISMWDTSIITNMGSMFQDAVSFNQPVGDWNTSNVTNMSMMFSRARAFNQDVSRWDVSKVTSLWSTFELADSFNSDLSQWDVSNVTNFSRTLRKASQWSGDISMWDMSSATNCTGMLDGLTGSMGDISGWNVSNVTNMAAMFSQNYVFNQDISSWDVSNVTTMESMFYDSAFNRDLSHWDTSGVVNLSKMFQSNKVFNQDISTWDTSNVTDMSMMFDGASAFNQDLSRWCVSGVQETNKRFSNSGANWTLPKPVWGTCPNGLDDYKFRLTVKVTNVDNLIKFKVTPFNESPDDIIVDWGDGNVETYTPSEYTLPNQIEHIYDTVSTWIIGITGGADSFKVDVLTNVDYVEVLSWGSDVKRNIQLGGNILNVPKEIPTYLSDLSSMFELNGEGTIGNVPPQIRFWDVSNVTNMSNLFKNRVNKIPSIENWNTSNNTSLSSAFEGCVKFNQDISSWDVSNVTNMSNLFKGCVIYNKKLYNWSLDSLTDASGMFSGASSFNQFISWWDVSNVTNMDNMFNGASAFNQDLSGWCVSSINTQPIGFSLDDKLQPIWGSCPMVDESDFITISVETDDVNNNLSFELLSLDKNPLPVSIDWGDGSNKIVIQPEDYGDQIYNVHTYTTSGQYIVKVLGNIKRYSVTGGSKLVSLDLINYGNGSLQNIRLGGFAKTIPNVLPSHITDLSYMFARMDGEPSVNLETDISTWNTSNVTNMSGMFLYNYEFNQDISSWDVSNVTDMSTMFGLATSFNQDIGNWNVSNVTALVGMFIMASSFNQDISGWDVSNVIAPNGLLQMFYLAGAFNQDLSGWCVSSYPEEPSDFATEASAWVLPKPVWGTCPANV